MERAQAFTVENFISNWNGDFPNYPLTAADLKKPHAVMGALFQVFDRLGIDRDAVLAAPPEESRNSHIAYYWDLLPVINMTRVINHLVSVMPQVDATISVTHFLQPTTTTSHSILLLLFNLMVFNEERLRDIAPAEEELFSKTDEVKTLENRKNKLLEMLNKQAEDKGKRTERLEKLDIDIKQLEEELKQEKEAHEEDKRELEAIMKEEHQKETVLEQKMSLKETLLSEVARKRALRVYDADDVKAQHEQAARDVQEAEEKLTALQNTLMQKESSLKNLQTIKPVLDTAQNLLHDIMKQSESLNSYSCGDLDFESQEGELEVLSTERASLAAKEQSARAARARQHEARRLAQAARDQQRRGLESALREEEEKEKKSQERSKKALLRTQEIKDLTAKYDEQKTSGMNELAKMKEDFTNQLRTIQDSLLKKAMDVEKRIEEKLRNRSL